MLYLVAQFQTFIFLGCVSIKVNGRKTKVSKVVWIYVNFVIINDLERIFRGQVGWKLIIRDKFTVGWCVFIGWVYLGWIIVDYSGKVIVGLHLSVSLGIFDLKIIVDVCKNLT